MTAEDMEERDAQYRQDDLVNTGYCPKCGEHCGEVLSGLTVGGMGYCDQHGWVYANWERPKAKSHD